MTNSFEKQLKEISDLSGTHIAHSEGDKDYKIHKFKAKFPSREDVYTLAVKGPVGSP